MRKAIRYFNSLNIQINNYNFQNLQFATEINKSVTLKNAPVKSLQGTTERQTEQRSNSLWDFHEQFTFNQTYPSELCACAGVWVSFFAVELPEEGLLFCCCALALACFVLLGKRPIMWQSPMRRHKFAYTLEFCLLENNSQRA